MVCSSIPISTGAQHFHATHHPDARRRVALAAAALAQAQPQVVNLYSARHYSTDQALYDNFTKETGIVVRRLDGREDELVERIRNEGAASPADILITVDASRLDAADKMGLFQPVQSAALQSRIPANLRTPNWLAFSTRARVVVYDKSRIDRASVPTYESLADPKLKGQLCVRSGAHPYNLSLARP
jgi:iron(III) transport system substrate-binding protein